VSGVAKVKADPLRTSKAGNPYLTGVLEWGGKRIGFFATGKVAKALEGAEGIPFFVAGFLRSPVNGKGAKELEITVSEAFPVEEGFEGLSVEVSGYLGEGGVLLVLIPRSGEKAEVAEVPLAFEGTPPEKGERIYAAGLLQQGRVVVVRWARMRRVQRQREVA